MDAYGRRTSAEILADLTALHSIRSKILGREEVSKSANGKQSVFDSKARLADLAKEEERLQAQLAVALANEGVANTSAAFQIYPR